MSDNTDFINLIRQELKPLVGAEQKGLALFTKKGEIFHSDLSSEVIQKILLFKPSFPGLTIGSNITLAVDNESVIVMCTSEETLIAVRTKQSVGLALVVLSNITKKYGGEFDKYAQTAIAKSPEAVLELAKKAEAVGSEQEVEGELNKEEFEAYQKSLVYELVPPLTPDNVLDKVYGLWKRDTRLLLRNLDQNLTIEQLQEGLNNAGFNVTWQWVLETLHGLEARGITRIKSR